MVYLIYLNNFWYNLVMLGAKASVHIILDQLFIIFLTHHGENLYVMWYFILNGLFVEWYHDMGIHYLVHVRCSMTARLSACWKYKQHHCDYECGVRKHGDKWTQYIWYYECHGFQNDYLSENNFSASNRFWKILLSFNQSNCGTVSKMIKDTWQIHYKSMFKKLIMFPIFFISIITTHHASFWYIMTSCIEIHLSAHLDIMHI